MRWTTMAGAGALVVLDDRLLMVQQRRPYGVHWELPSGYYEPGETFEEAAAREVLEETAIAVQIEGFVCSMMWQREHDRRRNVLAYFLATPLDAAAQPRAQTEEAIDDARYVDPTSFFTEIHPLYQPLLERWWKTREAPFHIHADVAVEPDGTQSYEIRVS